MNENVKTVKRHIVKMLTEKTRYINLPGLTTCWVWTGGKSFEKYGQIVIARRNYIAHRVSWFMFRGRIPPKLYVCHKCDNPLCWRPNHLFLGTNRDNQVDWQVKRYRRLKKFDSLIK